MTRASASWAAARLAPRFAIVVLAGTFGVAASCSSNAADVDHAGKGETRVTGSADAPDKAIGLPKVPSGMASSGKCLFVQFAGLNQVVVADWTNLDRDTTVVPILCPRLTAVVTDGRALSYATLVDWLHLVAGPVRPEYVAASQRDAKTVKAEPYLEEYKRLDGRQLFLRAANENRADPIEVISKVWALEKMAPSQDGTHAAMSLTEDFTITKNFERGKIRIGVYTEKKVVWIDGLGADPTPPTHRPSVQALAIPNDASRVGVIGHNGKGGWVACVDVVKKTVIWEHRNLVGTVGFYGGDFSRDGKTLYAGGTMGDLYRYDGATGKELGKVHIGTRIEHVATSPDGKLIAVGLANIAGTVCLIDPEASKVVRRITTGSSNITGLAWSPDSGLLAVTGCASGEVKIYKVHP